jgi:CheY-like chemotaxis protein
MDFPSIVMIDSSPEAADLVRFALWKGNLRCSFHVYSDAATARRCLLQQRRRTSDSPLPSLILLESDLDGADGLDMLRELRADPDLAGVPVVAFPSYDMEGEDAALAAGATEYMPKPVDAERYARCIAEFYRRWCQPQEQDADGAPVSGKARPGDWMRPAAQWRKPPVGN